ncbi:Udp-glycosyltransferase 83a1 [Thalictrum thalictroides]|uniref:Udp-glycosyltransferase 83a1 n=1 Tax=Thalictrum thalictroides TaxID=46969 RepID=A0A7J6WC52_THATH|nr:Udp-glycosyltransferase 83a1 [Thalictrum thalictroides]
MARPHLLVVPYPAQGHVMPLMELSHNLVGRGFKITFVDTESIHNRVVSSISNGGDVYEDFILPDGKAEEDRNDLGKINETNNGDDRISCYS